MNEAKSAGDIGSALAKAGDFDRFELSRLYGRAAAWIKGGRRPPACEAAWLAARLDAIKDVLWKAASDGADGKDFENRIAKAAGVTRSKRGHPKKPSVDVRAINNRLRR